MKADTWLARCADELQHLCQTNPRRAEDDVLRDEWVRETAGTLIDAQRYRGLDPVQAARAYWRDSH